MMFSHEEGGGVRRHCQGHVSVAIFKQEEALTTACSFCFWFLFSQSARFANHVFCSCFMCVYLFSMKDR